MLDPEPAQLPDRQPRALQQRPRLAGEHPHGAPVGERRDHPEPGPAPRRGQRARVAVRHHRHRPPGGQRRVEQRGAVLAERGARGLVLARRSPPPPRAPRPPSAPGPAASAASRTRSTAQARLRAVGRQVASRSAPASSAPSDGARATSIASPNAGGDADQRRARAPRAARSRPPCPPRRSRTSTTSSRAGRRRLVEHVQALAVPAQRRWSARSSPAILRADGARPVGHRPAQGLRRRCRRCAASTSRSAPASCSGCSGPNGAGKSTLVKIACGLVRADRRARSTVCGQPGGLARRRRRRSGYLAELFRFPDWCTADELLALHQELSGSPGGAAERQRAARARRARRRPRPPRSARCRRACSSGSGSPRR